MEDAASHRRWLSSLAATPIDQAIAEEDVARALAHEPFVTLPGAMNVRDVAFDPLYVKPRTIYRSGALDRLSDASRAALRSQLGLSTVIDFRRDDEVKAPMATVDGLNVVRYPYMDGKEMPKDISVADFAPTVDKRLGKGYHDMNEAILQGYTTGFRAVFEKLKTAKEGEAVLFHCAGT